MGSLAMAGEKNSQELLTTSLVFSKLIAKLWAYIFEFLLLSRSDSHSFGTAFYLRCVVLAGTINLSAFVFIKQASGQGYIHSPVAAK